MGVAMIEHNLNYQTKRKYNVYAADEIDIQPVGKGDKIFDSDKLKDIARWVKDAREIIVRERN